MAFKKKFVIVLLSLIIFTAGCRHAETYKFLHETDEIMSISIVSVSFDEQGELLQKELGIINDIPSFIEDFRLVGCYTYYGDPTGLPETGEISKVFKVTYQNGDFELINWNGQAEYTQMRGFQNYVGLSVFDESGFYELIDKYLPE